MTKVLSATVDALRGTVRLAGTLVPDGSLVVTRRTGLSAPVTIRGGVLDVTTSGFIVTDSEALFGDTLTYRVVDTVTSQYVQSNRVLNPKFAVDLTNWTFNTTDRSVARETSTALVPARDATTSARIGPRTAGAGAGSLTERFLARCSPSGFTTGTWYVSGQIRYDSPDIWLWDDAKSAGTWQTIKNKGAWQDVKAAQSPAAGQPFATLWVGVLSSNGTTVLTTPVQLLGIQTSDNGGWATFQGAVTIPAGAPANCQLAFYQGTATREYAVTWWLSTVMVMPQAESLNAGAVLPYFDGDTPLASVGDPGSRMAPGADWAALTPDASMTWQGTPNASWSQFTGPSQIFAEVTTSVQAPDPALLPRVKIPIFLSDPVVPQLAQWFELVEMGDLTYAARQQLYDILGRRFQIAVSQVRAQAGGELRLMTYTLAQAEVAERLFASGRILYWRNPDTRYPENGWYVGIGDVAVGRVGATVAWSPERIWRIPFVRVERPEGLIEAANSITWSTVRAGYTWQTMLAQRTDWLDVALTGPSS